jgi:hypothetical protein
MLMVGMQQQQHQGQKCVLQHQQQQVSLLLHQKQTPAASNSHMLAVPAWHSRTALTLS